MSMQRVQVLDDIRVHVDHLAVLAQLHIKPESAVASRIASLVAQVQTVIRPLALYRECRVERHNIQSVWIEGVEFTSHALAAMLKSVTHAFAYVVTCGREVDELIPPDGGVFEELALDTILNHLLRASCNEVEQRLGQRYQLGKTATMGPGAGDGELWPLVQQRNLFGLLGDTDALIGVKLTKENLMLPMKSLSGLLFPTEIDFSSCQLCQSQGCFTRNAPFDQTLRDALGAGQPHPY